MLSYLLILVKGELSTVRYQRFGKQNFANDSIDLLKEKTDTTSLDDAFLKLVK